MALDDAMQGQKRRGEREWHTAAAASSELASGDVSASGMRSGSCGGAMSRHVTAAAQEPARDSSGPGAVPGGQFGVWWICPNERIVPSMLKWNGTKNVEVRINLGKRSGSYSQYLTNSKWGNTEHSPVYEDKS
jgi:hypothetical protein